MARLKVALISAELRTTLAAYGGLSTIVRVSTGIDLRNIPAAAKFPAAVLQAVGTVSTAFSIGGAALGVHAFEVLYLFRFADAEDIELTKQTVAEQLFDWLMTNKVGTNYQVVMPARGGSLNIQYQPREELQLRASENADLAALKLEFQVEQRTTFAM